MLAIGRALMAAPRLLLLDEPSLGLAPILVEQIFDDHPEINAQGTTILLVEQNALMALGSPHRGYMLQTGEIVLYRLGRCPERDEGVRRAYLGATEASHVSRGSAPVRCEVVAIDRQLPAAAVAPGRRAHARRPQAVELVPRRGGDPRRRQYDAIRERADGAADRLRGPCLRPIDLRHPRASARLGPLAGDISRHLRVRLPGPRHRGAPAERAQCVLDAVSGGTASGVAECRQGVEATPAQAPDGGPAWPDQFTSPAGYHLFLIGIDMPAGFSLNAARLFRIPGDGSMQGIDLAELESPWPAHFAVIGIPGPAGTHRLAVWPPGKYRLSLTFDPRASVMRTLEIDVEAPPRP